MILIKGDRLQRLREGAGLSREQLATQVDVGVAMIARYEREQNDPTGEVIAKLARRFNVSSDYLLGITNELPSSALAASMVEQMPAAMQDVALDVLRVLAAHSGE